MKLISYPSGWHSYQELFARALRNSGIEYITGIPFSDNALMSRPDVDGIHFHWIEYLLGARSITQRLRLLFGFVKYINKARQEGKRIIWTVHNHTRHEGGHFLDYFAYRKLASMADLVIVHSRWSEKYIRDNYYLQGSVKYMPIGNYDGIFKLPNDLDTICTRYGLDRSKPICGLIGGVRPYRGHELAIAAHAAANYNWQLLIAGGAIDGAYAERIRSLLQPHKNTTCILRQVSDEEYSDLVGLCDIVLLPYDTVTGSAAMMSAWTLSRPIITSGIPFFKEFQPRDEAAGCVMSNMSPQAINESINKLLCYSRERREAASRAEADRYSWNRVIQPVADVFREWNSTLEKQSCSYSI